MGIQKEREEFEKFMKSIGCPDWMFDRDDEGDYDDMSMNYSWSAWYEAKKTAVPEGYALIPIQELQHVLSTASDALGDENNSSVYLTTGEPSTWFDHFTVAENVVLKAIEAQEQSHE